MVPLSLQALAAATKTDPNDTSEQALSTRANARKALLDQQQQAADAAHPLDAQQAYNRDMENTNNVLSGGVNAQWSPFFEALQEAGDRNGGKSVSIGSAPGLPTDSTMGTLPASLRGLDGATYGYDAMGLPTSVSMNRKKQAPATQPAPWSLG